MASHRTDVRVRRSLLPDDSSPHARGKRVLQRRFLAAVVVALLSTLAVSPVATGTDAATSTPDGLSASCSALSALETVDVADGFERVVSDGTGRQLDRGRIREVAVDVDGRVWLAVGRNVVALGEPGAIEPRSDDPKMLPRQLSVTPSGDLWAVEDGGSVVAMEGETWVDRSAGMTTVDRSLGALEDGSVWRVARGPKGHGRIVELVDDEWRRAVVVGLDGWLGARDTDFDFAQTADGRRWIGFDHDSRQGGLAVDGEAGWTLLGPLGTVVAPRVLGLTADPDGSLWVLADLKAARSRPGDYVLLRYDGTTWDIFGSAEGMPTDDTGSWTGWAPSIPNPIVVDDSGRVWFSLYQVGLFVFDGTDFERVTAPGLGLGALDLDVGPDGRVWVVSARGALYTVCDPAASMYAN